MPLSRAFFEIAKPPLWYIVDQLSYFDTAGQHQPPKTREKNAGVQGQKTQWVAGKGLRGKCPRCAIKANIERRGEPYMTDKRKGDATERHGTPHKWMGMDSPAGPLRSGAHDDPCSLRNN